MDIVLGFDPGTKHLGICAFDCASLQTTTVYWDLVDASSVHHFLEAMRRIEHLIRNARVAVIERQPPQNGQAKMVQHWIQLFIAMHNDQCTVTLVQPQSRISLVRRARPDLQYATYAQRKKSSVIHVQRLVAETPDHHIIDAARKKDDLAEAYILARMARTICNRIEEEPVDQSHQTTQ
jgi:Holliday junction resolvasome RuvABC endonuclease subunit